MKKIVHVGLAVSVAISAMVYAGAASAAVDHTVHKVTAGEKLSAIGMIQGDANGGLLETSTWEKQDLAVLVARLVGKESEAEETVKSHTFTDVEDEYYDGYISWAVQQGYLTGINATKFGMNEVVSYKTLNAVLLRVLGHDTKGLNYFNTGELAVDLGLVEASADLDAPAIRGVAYGMILKVLATSVPDTMTAGETLKGYGVIAGDAEGVLGETAAWEKQDLAVLVARLVGKESEAEETEKSHTFADVEDEYYDGYISWAVQQGYLTGINATTFGFNEPVTYKTLAAVILRVLGHDTKGLNYFNTTDLAVAEGLFTEDTDFDAVSARGVAFGVILEALHAKKKGSDTTLGAALGISAFLPQ